MTTTGDATAFLRSSSAMNFNMIVQVYDSNMNTLLSEDKSNVATTVYGGQYIRKSVSTGQYLVIGVEMSGSTFVSNSYEVGVVRQEHKEKAMAI